MQIEKIRNLGDEELMVQERQAAEQLFRLRFQIRSGQQEGVKTLRGLKKDVARFKTVARDRALHGTEVGAVSAGAAKAAAAKAAAAKAAVAVTKPKAKKAPAKAAKSAAATGKAAK
jgi:large subunit ribosomal protein L29